jgi:putative transposase
MRTWLQRLLLVCLRLIQVLLQWLRRPVRSWWARACATSGPRRGWAQPKPLWVRREVIRLKALMPNAGCRTIAHCFNRRFAVSRHMTVGKTYVADTIRREQYAIMLARRKLKHATPRSVPRNLIWGLDLAVKTDSQGTQHLLLAIVEHASRACLLLQQLQHKSAWMLLTHLIQALKRYGRPRYLRTDNEGACTSLLFRLSLWLLGIRHQRTAPFCPWENGRVERCIGTLKRSLALWRIEDGEQLDRALTNVRAWYNHVRPHAHLHGRTPAEVWAGVDVFADTPQAAIWRQHWEGQWRRAGRAGSWGSA